MVKREAEPSAEEQAAKKKRIASSGEDKTQITKVATPLRCIRCNKTQVEPILSHSAPPATQMAAEVPVETPAAQHAMQTPMAMQTATPMAAEVPVEPIATPLRNQPARESFEELHARHVLRAETKMKYYFSVIQRSSMQLAAARDGRRREIELQLEPVRNRNGEIMGYYDPDVADGIDRLFVRIWTPENMIMGKATYVCFLDCTFDDTVSTLKTKIQQHPNLAHMGLLNVILLYKGRMLGDAETLPQCEIDDDCILHAVNGNDAFFNVCLPIGQVSNFLHQWRLILRQ